LSSKQKRKTIPDVDQLAQHLPKPMNGLTMETLRILVEKGNQSKNRKKKSKVTLGGQT
jgi:hypothetical protein